MDLPDDWWTVGEVATFLGVKRTTLSAYLARGQMPPPDRRFGRTLAWRPETIRDWRAGRDQTTQE